MGGATIRRGLIAALVVGGLTGCAAERPADPVVLTGADVPRLIGAAPGKVIAYRWYQDQWQQLPVQVDERAVIDLNKPYNGTATGSTFLAYTDPNTWTGPDPDPNVDADDEIAFMGFDGGFQPPGGTAAPAGTVPGSGERVAVTDSLGNAMAAYVYLFRQTGSLDPGAGKDYVAYNFDLLSGNYKTTYKLAAGPNPEDTTASSPYYSQHFSDRWVDDGLRITAPGASGVDILDRHKDLFGPGVCGRSEDTFSAGEGAMIVNKDGPVRAIRSYIGANSGRYTVRTHRFYGRRQEITTDLRVHPIPGVMDFFDYSPAASGMTYKSDVAPGGVTIDGVPDSPAAGPVTWETVNGGQGSLGMVHTFSTDIPGFAYTSYYLDKQSPGGGAETQCTGDGSAYGSSGPWVTQAIPNTDPTLGAANRFSVTRTLFYDSPGTGDGARRKAQVTSPLQTAVAAFP